MAEANASLLEFAGTPRGISDSADDAVESALHPVPFEWLSRPTPSCAGAAGVSGFELATVPAYPHGPSSQARGEALHSATVDVPTSFEVEVRDRFGNPLRNGAGGWTRQDNGSSWTDASVLTVLLEPAFDAVGNRIEPGSVDAVAGRQIATAQRTGGSAGGLWTVSYTPRSAGQFWLEVLVAYEIPDVLAPPVTVERVRQRVRVPGSPFKLNIATGSATGRSLAWGQGLSLAVAGRGTVFAI